MVNPVTERECILPLRKQCQTVGGQEWHHPRSSSSDKDDIQKMPDSDSLFVCWKKIKSQFARIDFWCLFTQTVYSSDSLKQQTFWRFVFFYLTISMPFLRIPKFYIFLKLCLVALLHSLRKHVA